MFTEKSLENIHILTSDEKLQRYGYGEWVEEPDWVYFIYKDFKCQIRRGSSGHLCGYVLLPDSHPYYGKSCWDIELDVHGGITYSKEEDSIWWIGFDCAHMGDLVPSIQNFKQEIKFSSGKRLKEIKETMINLGVSPKFLEDSYKNVAYCIKECESMVDQLIEIEQKHLT